MHISSVKTPLSKALRPSSPYKKPEDDTDFSMDTSSVENQVSCWCAVVVSKTMLAFHLTVVLVIVLVCLIASHADLGACVTGS